MRVETSVRDRRLDMGRSTPAAVLIVDADDAARRRMAALLERAGFATREAAGGEEGLDAARLEEPLLVVLEVSLPDVSGYMVCRQLREELGEELPIVFVSAGRTEPHDRMAGLLLGADEYFAKPVHGDEFVLRLRRLTRGRAIVPEPSRAPLTVREREILRLLADGLAPKQIAHELHLSPKTVNTHAERIYRKLGVHSRTQAVTAAMRDALI